MKTCKDCLHYEVCEESYSTSVLNYIMEQCDKFTDRSEWVRIPCKVDDKIYCDGKYFAEHRAGEVMEFIVGDVKTDVCTYHRGEIDMIFRFSDFGKTVFLTREEAEKCKEDIKNVNIC